jgi:uncharacterized protein YigA (DUF484 family)
MEMLRERIKGLEQKIVELIRNSQDNAAIADRLHQWTMRIVHTRGAGALPQVLLDDLQQRFMIPQVALRLWDVAEPFAELRVARPVSEDLKAFAGSLSAPYCGANAGFEASGWFDEPATVLSMAMLPLRRTAGEPAFGLLVLGSPDPTRYSAQMGTEFLARLAEVASAALARLLRSE